MNVLDLARTVSFLSREDVPRGGAFDLRGADARTSLRAPLAAL